MVLIITKNILNEPKISRQDNGKSVLGQWAAINDYDRTEISAIGFEVLGNGDATFLIGPSTIPEPGTLLLFGLGAVMVCRKRRAHITS